MKPAKSILDPTFAYTPALHTSLAKTFARIRAERAAEAEAAKAKRAEDERRWAAHLGTPVSFESGLANVTELRKVKP